MAVSAAKALAALRVAVGTLFLIFGEYKVFGTQFTIHGGFQHWIKVFLQDGGGAYPFLVPVLKGFVLPHAVPIAFLVAYGELAIGIALVLGVWVRAASVCGAIYMLTLLFSANYPGAGGAVLAVLRGFPRTSGASALLRGIRHHQARRHAFPAKPLLARQSFALRG